MSDRGKPVKIKHSRMSVVAAAFFMLNGVVIVVVSDAAPWLNYLILALVVGIGGLAAWYISVPAFSFSTGECVVRQSPAVRAINLDMERVAAWGRDKAKHRAIFLLDDNSEVSVQVRLDDEGWERLTSELESRGVPLT